MRLYWTLVNKEIRQSAAVVTAKCRHLVIKGLIRQYLTEGKI